MVYIYDGCEVIPCQYEQDSRPPTALRIRQSSTTPSPTPDTVRASDAYEHFTKDRKNRPSSHRLSTELDELLRWEGLSRPGSTLILGNSDTVDVSSYTRDPKVVDSEDVDVFDDDFNDSMGYSELNDILASARRKLDLLEDNLRGARNSLFIVPALPSPASTSSLRSTISSTMSHTFSAISDDEISSDSTIPSIMADPVQTYNNDDLYPTTVRGCHYSEASIPLANGQMDNDCGFQQYGTSNSSVRCLHDGSPPTPKQNEAMNVLAQSHSAIWSPVANNTVSNADDPSEMFNPEVYKRGPAEAPIRRQGLGYQVDCDSKDSADDVRAYQAKKSELFSSLRGVGVPRSDSFQALDMRRFSACSVHSTATARPIDLLPPPAIITSASMVDDCTVLKHASFSTATSSGTETESYSSGWDSDSDEDSDTEEIELDGTWPMPPASTSAKLPTPLQSTNATSRQQLSGYSPSFTVASNDDGRITPRGVHIPRKLSNITPMPPRQQQAQQVVIPPRRSSLILHPNEQLPPLPQPLRSMSRNQNVMATAVAASVSISTTTTAVAPSLTPATHAQMHALQVDSKVLDKADQALAFTLAESMRVACLKLRDGDEEEKLVWRERIERARKVLSGEI